MDVFQGLQLRYASRQHHSKKVDEQVTILVQDTIQCFHQLTEAARKKLKWTHERKHGRNTVWEPSERVIEYSAYSFDH